MIIEQNADTAGIIPENYKDTPEVFTIRVQEGLDDCLDVSEEEGKKGNKLTRFTLHCEDKDGNARVLRYLWKRNLASLSRAYGEESAAWEGQKFVLTAKKNSNGYFDPVLEAEM